MRKKYCLIFSLIFIIIITGYAQDPGVFSLTLSPGGILPFETTVGEDQGDYYSTSGGLGLRGEYIPIGTPFLITGGGLDYVIAPSNTEVSNIEKRFSYLSLTGKAGFVFELMPVLSFELSGSAGYNILFGDGRIGSGPSLGGLAGLYFRLNKNLSIGLNASYVNYFKLYNDINDELNLGTAFHGLGVNISTRFSFGRQKESNLEIKDIHFFQVFPVFYKYYDENPIGEVVIKNNEKGTIKDVKVNFFIKQYMDQPKLCATIDELKDKEEIKVLIYALFADSVLSITEGTKVVAEIQTEYNYREEKQTNSLVESIKIENRNPATMSTRPMKVEARIRSPTRK
jgi:hypothetical protein